MPAPAALTVALTNLLYLDGRTMPDSPDRDALFDYVGASRWLRFGLGVGPDEPMPHDDDAGARRRGRRVRQALADVDGVSRAASSRCRRRADAPVRFRIERRRASTKRRRRRFPRRRSRSSRRGTRAASRGRTSSSTGAPTSGWRRISSAHGRALAGDERAGIALREESFAVLGLDRDEAWRLGEAFQQLAIYYIDRGVPLLVARRRGRVVTWEGALCAA